MVLVIWLKIYPTWEQLCITPLGIHRHKQTVDLYLLSCFLIWTTCEPRHIMSSYIWRSSRHWRASVPVLAPCASTSLGLFRKEVRVNPCITVFWKYIMRGTRSTQLPVKGWPPAGAVFTNPATGSEEQEDDEEEAAARDLRDLNWLIASGLASPGVLVGWSAATRGLRHCPLRTSSKWTYPSADFPSITQ